MFDSILSPLLLSQLVKVACTFSPSDLEILLSYISLINSLDSTRHVVLVVSEISFCTWDCLCHFFSVHVGRHSIWYYLNHFHWDFSFVFCLVVSNNPWGRSLLLNILDLILRVVPVLFLTAVFSFFSCVSDNFISASLYSTIYTNYRTFAAPL